MPASQQNVAEIGLNVLECPWKVLEFIFLPNLWPPCAVDWGSRLLRGHLVDQEQTGRVWWLKPAEDGTRLERSQGSVSRQSTLEISFSSTHPSECHSLNQGLVQWFCRYIYVLQTPSFEGIDTRKGYSCDCFCWLCADRLVFWFRDRPAAIQIEVKSIDDTSNFDEFPDIDLKWRELFCTVSQWIIAVFSRFFDWILDFHHFCRIFGF